MTIVKVIAGLLSLASLAISTPGFGSELSKECANEQWVAGPTEDEMLVSSYLWRKHFEDKRKNSDDKNSGTFPLDLVRVCAWYYDGNSTYRHLKEIYAATYPRVFFYEPTQYRCNLKKLNFDKLTQILTTKIDRVQKYSPYLPKNLSDLIKLAITKDLMSFSKKAGALLEKKWKTGLIKYRHGADQLERLSLDRQRANNLEKRTFLLTWDTSWPYVKELLLKLHRRQNKVGAKVTDEVAAKLAVCSFLVQVDTILREIRKAYQL